MIRHFLEYIAIEKKYSQRTVEAYRDDLRDFCIYCGWEPDEYDPKQVTEADIKDWLIDLMDKDHLSKRSVKRKLSCLKSFYKFLLRAHIVTKDVTLMVDAPKVDKPLPVFFKPSEMEQVTQMDAHADDFESIRNSLIIQMLYQTGMRRAEMLGLTDADVDTRAAQVRIFGKRKKERIVPMGESLVKLIDDYREARADICKEHEITVPFGTFFVKCTKKGEVKPLDRQTLYYIVRDRMGEVSTLRKHSPHVLRHTFATTMLENGADIRTIQQLMGHASLAATQVYTHTTFEQIRKVYDNAHPRANKRKE